VSSASAVNASSSSRNLLELIPVRSAEWDERDDRVIVLRPKPSTSGLRAVFDWLSYSMAPGRLRLDDVGTHSWRLIDGRRSVLEIATLVRAEFGERAEPCEERLGKFMQQLKREELVRFPEVELEGD
jgi:hypothetical protein